MQDAIEKVKQISLTKNNTGAEHGSKPTTEQKQQKRRDDAEKMKDVIWLRTMSNEDGERLHELTELGLSVDAARELREQEKAIAEVHRMLEEKKKKTGTKNNEAIREKRSSVETRPSTSQNRC